MNNRLGRDFFTRDVLEVAPALLGKLIVRCENSGNINKYRITEVEAYRGEEDKACHASKGRTHRNDVMYWEGGHIYVYLIYGMYWMLNIVTGEKDNPQAVLIRGVDGYDGPGKLTRRMNIDKSQYGEDVTTSGKIWIEDDGYANKYIQTPRINIDYAGEFWKNKPWRFILDRSMKS
ncbi:MAG: DNA-3-methyladenine glycosylase [Bacteroidales bacterium]|nr:DNA-3-methyladenine glycosylase [Bacteroidales bacterium]